MKPSQINIMAIDASDLTLKLLFLLFLVFMPWMVISSVYAMDCPICNMPDYVRSDGGSNYECTKCGMMFREIDSGAPQGSEPEDMEEAEDDGYEYDDQDTEIESVGDESDRETPVADDDQEDSGYAGSAPWGTPRPEVPTLDCYRGPPLLTATPDTVTDNQPAGVFSQGASVHGSSGGVLIRGSSIDKQFVTEISQQFKKLSVTSGACAFPDTPEFEHTAEASNALAALNAFLELVIYPSWCPDFNNHQFNVLLRVANYQCIQRRYFADYLASGAIVFEFGLLTNPDQTVSRMLTVFIFDPMSKLYWRYIKREDDSKSRWDRPFTLDELEKYVQRAQKHANSHNSVVKYFISFLKG